MNWRRLLLGAVVGFVCFIIWKVVDINTETSVSTIWPLCVTLLIVLALPEKRLNSDKLIRLVEALRKKPNDE